MVLGISLGNFNQFFVTQITSIENLIAQNLEDFINQIIKDAQGSRGAM
ncbi:hypothetical protein [Helicobacter sp.]|nr:hypothetical protein [Helicobacter sp.]MCI5968841.1 hypothetical protein [Helicobacter sp.]MDY2585026.1 hypothetical protein [Helicobacter sp.]